MTSTSASIGHRRLFLAAALLTAWPLTSVMAQPAAGTAPVVRIVVPYAAGGGNDQIARVIAAPLSAALGQPVIVENRPGAGSMLGTRLVAKATPDGTTLLLSATSMSTNAILQRNAGYRMADFATVAPVLASPMTLSVASHLPIRNLKELVTYAKANPGKLNFASVGGATVTTLTMERFRLASDIQVTHIPYGGVAPAMNALLAGQVDLMMDGMANSVAQAKSSRIRLLAVTRGERPPAAPDLPTFKEQGFPSLTIGSWAALFVPAQTPAPIVQKLRAAAVKVLTEPAVQEVLGRLGFDPWPGKAEAFADYLIEETAAWERDIKAAGVPMVD